MPELGKYAIAYTAFGKGGPGVSLALTEDFVHFERCGLVMQPDDKDAALLPRRIDGMFALVHRPIADSGAHVWISYSPDLRNWGGHKLMLQARRGGWWDANKVGLSPPLIETERGWLMIYHGVRHTAAGSLYRLGVALFDLEQPERLLLRGDEWIFGPEAPYETQGDVGNVAFPVRLHDRPRRRHDESLLRRRRHLHRAGDGEHPRDPGVARSARERVLTSGERASSPMLRDEASALVVARVRSPRQQELPRALRGGSRCASRSRPRKAASSERRVFERPPSRPQSC